MLYLKKMAGKPKTLELRISLPATPERVEASAKFFGAMLRAANPDLREGSVTLVVTNFNMGTALRAQNDEGKSAINRCIAVLKDPETSTKKSPEAMNIANAISHVSPLLLGSKIIRPQSQKAVALLDERFIGRVKRCLRPLSHPVLRGSTVIYSQVLRVGRLSEGEPVKIRIQLDNQWQDVKLADKNLSAEFYNAAAKEAEYPITVSTVWHKNGDGLLLMDPKETYATGIDLLWRPIGGRDLIDLVQKTAPSGFDEAELLERVSHIQGVNNA